MIISGISCRLLVQPKVPCQATLGLGASVACMVAVGGMADVQNYLQLSEMILVKRRLN